MGVFDIYSKRLASGEVPEIYVYDSLPQKLRTQIHHIIKDAIGNDKYSHDHLVLDVFEAIQKVLKREYGVFYLGFSTRDPEIDVLNFLLKSPETEKVIDVIELTFRMINNYVKDRWQTFHQHAGATVHSDDAIKELNIRFKENSVGYVFDSNQIIRIDSTIVHEQVTKPALQFLSTPLFKNANEEYLKAHEHYRHGKNKEAIAECLKAFESVMKIIIKSKGWPSNENDTSKKLIQICFDNGLIPSYLQTYLSNLRILLESGIPTIRNKVGGHGQGDQHKSASDQLVRYALNLTGSNIIFLVEQSGLS